MRVNGETSLVRSAALWVGALGSLVFAAYTVAHALIVARGTDFAGFDAALHAQAGHLGCVYARSVQFAGARIVPGLVAPATPSGLGWHFNEPLILTYLIYPLSHLPLADAVAAWLFVSAVALGASGLLLWRQLGPVPRLLGFAVITSLLCNAVADMNFWDAQNDAVLLLVLLCGLALLRRGHDIGAGLIFGVVALKPQLVFLVLLVLVYQRRWRVAAAMCASAAALWSASLAMIGRACAVAYLHSAGSLGELQVGIGVPPTLARLAGTAFPAEVLFAVLCLGAAGLLWRLRARETELAISVALGCAVVIGLHTPFYDALFLAPLGAQIARRFPLAVFAAGWLVTMSQMTDAIIDLNYLAPVRTAEVALFAALCAATLVIWMHGEIQDTGRATSPLWLAHLGSGRAEALAGGQAQSTVPARKKTSPS